jgi:hypothetical protein
MIERADLSRQESILLFEPIFLVEQKRDQGFRISGLPVNPVRPHTCCRASSAGRVGALGFAPSQVTGLIVGRHLVDAVEVDDVTGCAAGFNVDIDDVVLGEQCFEATDDPTAGVQGQARVVDVDVNEVAGAIGKFKNEARDRYAVVREPALYDRSPELARGACKIAVEVG